MSELKPCPFCGTHYVKLIKNDDVGGAFVMCMGCHATTSIYGELSVQQAVNAWNRRSQDHNGRT